MLNRMCDERLISNEGVIISQFFVSIYQIRVGFEFELVHKFLLHLVLVQFSMSGSLSPPTDKDLQCVFKLQVTIKLQNVHCTLLSVLQ